MTKGDIGYLVMDVDASASQEALDMLHEVEGTIRVRVLFLIRTVNLKATALSVAFYRYLHYHVKSIPIDQIIKCQSSQKSQLHALGFLILAMLSVQSSASLAKVLFQNFPVLTVSAMRLCIGAFILAFIFQIWKINFSQVRWKAILSYGFALAGMNALFYLSLERLPIGIAVAFEFIGPLSVALYHAKQKYDFVWVTFAIIGLILLFPFNQAHSLDWIGVLFAMSAGACWALYIIAGQKPSGISGNHTVCLGMTVGACILLPITFSQARLGKL